MAEKANGALKWTIGIIAFIIYVAVGRGVILSNGAGFSHAEQEWQMSTGQSWAMVIWTIVVVVGAVMAYKGISKE